jgi:hypothetical protein
MPSTASTTTAKPGHAAQFVIDTARQGSDQVLALYRQAAMFGLDAAAMWLETVSALVPGGRIPPASVTEALAQYATATSDMAEKALRIQRELVAQAIGLLQSPSAVPFSRSGLGIIR